MIIGLAASGFTRHQIFIAVSLRKALLAHTNTILLSSTPLPLNCLERGI